MDAELALPSPSEISTFRLFDGELLVRRDTHLESLANLPPEVSDADTCALWRKASTTGAKIVKDFEKARKAVTSKIDAFKKAVMEKEVEAIRDLVDADRLLTTVLLTYDAKVRAEEARRQAVLAAEAAKAQEQGRETLDLAAANVVAPEPVATGKPSTRDIRRPVVVDENQIPREFMTPDMKKIQAAIDAGLSIPGITFTTETVLIRR
jgi:hypothetical protein